MRIQFERLVCLLLIVLSKSRESLKNDAENVKAEVKHTNLENERKNDEDEKMFASPEYLETLKTTDMVCNPHVRNAFGMTGGENFIKPKKSGFKDRNYCMNSPHTCCNHKSIKKIIPRYNEGFEKFQKSFGVIQEIFALFSGKAFQTFFQYKAKDLAEDCSYLFVTRRSKEKKDFDFFSYENIHQHLVENEQISLEISSYIRGIQNFYGGLICTVCSSSNKFFEMYQSAPRFKISLSMCSKMIDMATLEYRLYRTFNYFFYPISRSINCVNKRDAEPEFSIAKLDKRIFEKKNEQIQSCLNEFSENNAECQLVCKRDFFLYRFPNQMINNYKQALKIIMEEFAHVSIEEYYQEINGYSFDSIETDMIVFISTNTKEGSNVNLKKAKFELDAYGMNFFHNYIRIPDNQSIVECFVMLYLFLVIGI